jgi:hypothetical protein
MVRCNAHYPAKAEERLAERSMVRIITGGSSIAGAAGIVGRTSSFSRSSRALRSAFFFAARVSRCSFSAAFWARAAWRCSRLASYSSLREQVATVWTMRSLLR